MLNGKNILTRNPVSVFDVSYGPLGSPWDTSNPDTGFRVKYSFHSTIEQKKYNYIRWIIIRLIIRINHTLLFKWTEHGKSSSITTDPQQRTKLKQITVNRRLGDNNRVNASNFNATIFKFSEKFDHPFSHVFLFGNMFPESRGFVGICRLPAVSKIHVPFYPYLITEGRRNCSTLWQAQQRNRDSQETCWNFLENLGIVALKLLDLTYSNHQT